MAHGAAFWEKVLAEVDAGRQQTEVAADFGVSTAAIRFWMTRRRRAETDGTARKPSSSHVTEFLPVRVTQPGAVRIELEVGGVVVRLIDGCEPAYVAELVRALRSC